MSNTTAGLIALLILAVLAVILFALGRMNESGHGSRINDLREILGLWRGAESKSERALILIWFLRALFRLGYYSAIVSVLGLFAVAAANIFGISWEIARAIVCAVLRFMEKLLFGSATSCEPAPAGPPVSPAPNPAPESAILIV